MKLAAQQLDAVPRLDRDFKRAQAYLDVHVEKLCPTSILMSFVMRGKALCDGLSFNRNHMITREQLSVRDHMSQILRRLHDVQFLEFNELFSERIAEGDTVAIIVVHFLAMLELVRESLVQITQAAPYDPIYVRLAFVRTADEVIQ